MTGPLELILRREALNQLFEDNELTRIEINVRLRRVKRLSEAVKKLPTVSDDDKARALYSFLAKVIDERTLLETELMRETSNGQAILAALKELSDL